MISGREKLIVPILELKRLQEAEAMVARFSRENEWLALQNTQLRTHRKHVDSDYVGEGFQRRWHMIETLYFVSRLSPGIKRCIQHRLLTSVVTLDAQVWNSS